MPKRNIGKYTITAGSALLVLALGACATTVIEKETVVPVAVPAGGTIIFQDDFQGSDRDDAWQQVRGVWAVEAGKMLQKRDDPREQNALLVIENDVADVEITTQVATSGGTSAVPGAGVVFRLRDADNYYMFRTVGSGGVVFGKMVDGEWFDLANPRAANFRVDGSLAYTEPLRVRTEGNRFQCWVGDDSVVNMTDEQFATGKVGLVTFKTTAEFDYFKVVEL